MDPIVASIGEFGPWQFWISALVFLSKFSVASFQVAIIFLAPPADFKCVSPANVSECSPKCNQIEYNRSVFEETIITQWNLVCDREKLANMSQTIFMLGTLLGNVFTSMLADKYGRRIPLIVSVIAQAASGVGAAFSPWFWMFCVLRFISGLALGGTMICGFVIVMEIIGLKWRETVSILYQLPFNIGHFSVAVFGYFLRDWRWYQFTLSFPLFGLIVYWWFVPESPRWLFIKGRIDESADILTKAAKRNGYPTEGIKENLEKAAAKRLEEQGKSATKGNILDLIRTPNLRKKTFICWINWFAFGTHYFGMSQYIGDIGGDVFLNVAVGAALGVPGTIACLFMVKSIGRKLSLIISNACSGAAILIVAFFPPEDENLTVIFASISLVAMSVTFPNAYVYTGELFPTVIRNIGVGTASMSARIGSMIAPFVVGLKTEHYYIPPIIFGVLPILSVVLTFWLPETLGQPLPETITDGENFGKKVKPPTE